ncbi:ATP-dependent Clp protease adapter protein ClpS [Campylobacterota bacterium]|nr:ATP-dependent Clp protease adapter protein ClpS [Campylobacterota bacterium]
MATKESPGGLTELSTEILPPKRYLVLLHNDHYTTWEFVVHVLESIFHKPRGEAETITRSVHNKGVGICGEYSFEIAQMKVAQTRAMAKANGFPLKSSLQEA